MLFKLRFVYLSIVGATIGANLDDALVGQRSNCLANRRSAYVKLFCEFLFLELMAGWKLSGKNCVSNLVECELIGCCHCAAELS